MLNTITIVHTHDSSGSAKDFASVVSNEYPEVEFEFVELPKDYDSQPKGDIVVVAFDSMFQECDKASDWLQSWNESRATTPLLPIAMESGFGKPPEPISGLKSKFFKDDESEILKTIGARMGLALRPGDNKLFVSYRSSDGKIAAAKIEEYFKSCGYVTWLDEARDAKDNTNLELGDDVQEEIERNISKANALILVDTPGVVDSKWVRLEVELAIGKMIPIYPIVLHPSEENTSTSRFRILQGLHRRVCIESKYQDDYLLFDDAELPKIVSCVEDYLLAVYRNRVIQPRELEKWFIEKKWDFGQNKVKEYLHDAKVGDATGFFSLLACCSFEDRIFTPRVKSYLADIGDLAEKGTNFTRNIFLYPGAALNKEDIKQIVTDEVPEMMDRNAMLLSYNEAVARIGTMAGEYYA